MERLLNCLIKGVNDVIEIISKKASIEEVTLESTSETFSNFKSLTFTVVDGSVIRIINGHSITFPYHNVLGSSYNNENLITTSVTLNATNGKCLVTIIK